MIPLPLLFGKPVRTDLKVSPQETWLAWTARDHGVLNLWVQRRSPSAGPRQITFRQDRDVCIFFVFTQDDRTLLYLSEPTNGSEFYHLYAVDLEADSEPRDLISDPHVTCVIGFAGPVQLWTPRERPREVLLATGSGTLFWDISRVNVDTCQRELVMRNPCSNKVGLVWFGLRTLWTSALRFITCGCLGREAPQAPVFWFLDRRGAVRGRIAVGMEGLTLCIYVSVLHGEQWVCLERITFKDLNMQLVGSSGGSGTMRMVFSDDGSSVLLHSCAAGDTTALVKYNVPSGERSDVVSSDSDIAGFLTHPLTQNIQAVKFYGAKASWQALDDAIATDLEFLTESFKGQEFDMQRPQLDETWVVRVSGDTEPGTSYLYERRSRTLTEVFRARPELMDFALASMHPVTVTARDGEKVLCYLSLPQGSSLEDAVPHPLVMYIHGGPNARDEWGFNPVCQLLASRGIAVMQVNYRGSTGFGSRWVKLGKDGAFSKSMQYDVEDAARWAVTSGVADPLRLAILGGSFGGYSALWHLTLGELSWRAGVAICAVSAVGKAGGLGFRGDPLFAQYWKDIFGAASLDLEVAKAASPLYLLDRLRAPLLLLHGESDPRVPLKQSDDLAAGVQQHGCGGAYVTYADEGHGLRKEPNILDMWVRVEKFLCEELQLPLPLSVCAPSSARLRWSEASSRLS